MNDDEMKKTLQGMLVHRRMEETADYLRAGRIYRDLPPTELARQWVEAQRAAWADMSDARARQLADTLISEFDARGEQPPLEDIEAEFQAAMVQVEHALERQTEEERAGRGEAFVADLDAFLSQIEAGKTN